MINMFSSISPLIMVLWHIIICPTRLPIPLMGHNWQLFRMIMLYMYIVSKHKADEFRAGVHRQDGKE